MKSALATAWLTPIEAERAVDPRRLLDLACVVGIDAAFDLVELFVDEAALTVAMMRDAADGQRVPTVRRLAAALESTSRAIGARRLSALCAPLVHATGGPRMRSWVDALEVEVDRVELELAAAVQCLDDRARC